MLNQTSVAALATAQDVMRPAKGAGRAPRRGLTLLLLASIVVSFLAASSVPTPLYKRYAAQWGFSPRERQRSCSASTRSRCWPAC